MRSMILLGIFGRRDPSKKAIQARNDGSG